MTYDLNDTLIFVKVAEAGSFTAAAAALKLPKTTVSRKVRELEDRLGARMLNRTTRRLSLTQAGNLYFEHCKRIFERLNQAEEAVQYLEGGPRGWLRITAPYSFGVSVLSPLLAEFRARYPEVQLDLMLTNDLLDLVADDIDVALRFGDLPNSSLVARQLAQYPCRIYASQAYLDQYGEPKHPDELRQHRALAHHSHLRGQNYRWLLNRGDEQISSEIQPVILANDPFVLMAMLRQGQGLMLVPEPMITCCPMGAELLPVLPEWHGPDSQLHAVFIGGRGLSPKVRAFIDFIADRLSSLCPEKAATADAEAQPKKSVPKLTLVEN